MLMIIRFFLLSLIVSSSANAVIIMNIDPINERISFSGSDSGDMATVSNIGEVTWDFNFHDTVDTSASLDVTSAFESTPSYSFTMSFDMFESGDYFLSFFATGVSASPITLTTTSASISYGDFTSSQKSALANFGTVTSDGLSKGTGFANVMTTAVPEPASAGMLIGCAVTALVGLRRR